MLKQWVTHAELDEAMLAYEAVGHCVLAGAQPSTQAQKEGGGHELFAIAAQIANVSASESHSFSQTRPSRSARL